MANDTAVRAITAKQAIRIMKKLGLCYGEDGRTFYATNADESEVWEYDTKKERDEAVKRMA